MPIFLPIRHIAEGPALDAQNGDPAAEPAGAAEPARRHLG